MLATAVRHAENMKSDGENEVIRTYGRQRNHRQFISLTDPMNTVITPTSGPLPLNKFCASFRFLLVKIRSSRCSPINLNTERSEARSKWRNRMIEQLSGHISTRFKSEQKKWNRMRLRAALPNRNASDSTDNVNPNRKGIQPSAPIRFQGKVKWMTIDDHTSWQPVDGCGKSQQPDSDLFWAVGIGTTTHNHFLLEKHKNEVNKVLVWSASLQGTLRRIVNYWLTIVSTHFFPQLFQLLPITITISSFRFLTSKDTISIAAREYLI